MKKIITLITTLFLFVSSGCNAKENTKKKEEHMEKKVLVAYFSYSGTTKRYAEKIAQMIENADLFEIQALQPYTDADVDWMDDSSRVNKEMKINPDSRPEIAKKVENIKEYDVVFIGFPIWWYIAPNIINTFLEAHDLQGKTIVPFFTSHSSGPGETDKHLRKSITYEVKWESSVRANRMNDKDLQKWINAILKK